MIDVINFLALTGADICNDATISGLLTSFYNIMRFAIPILLVVFGMIDLAKAVIAGKEDEMKKAQGTLIKRCIYAVAVFLVVTIVVLLVSLVGGDDGWGECFGIDTSNANSSDVE